MGTRNINFGDHDDEGKAGDIITFDVNREDFVITDTVVNGASILTSNDDGTQYSANVLQLDTANNMVEIQVPDDVKTGDYSYSLVLFDTQDMSNKVTCSTVDIIELEGKVTLDDPVIANVYFNPDLKTIDSINLMEHALTVTGTNLNTVDSISLTNLGVMFNIIFKTNFMVSARALNIPSIMGTRICQVQLHFTINDEYGEVIREDTITSAQTITIQGE